MINLGLISVLTDKLAITDMDVFLMDLIIAAILVFIGIVVGNFSKFILKKLIEHSTMQKVAKKSFIELFLTAVKWSLYVLFIAMALDQLGIPKLTDWLTAILVVIPAFVGAILLISIGFGVAMYLKDIVEESNIIGNKVLSMILFYFILYVFLVFALRTALIGQDKQTVNIIIIIFTAIISGAVAWWHVRQK